MAAPAVPATSSAAPPSPAPGPTPGDVERRLRLVLQQQVYQRVAAQDFLPPQPVRHPRPPPRAPVPCSYLLVDVEYLHQNCGYVDCVDGAKLLRVLEAFHGGQRFNKKAFIPTGEPQHVATERTLLGQNFRVTRREATRNGKGEVKGMETIATAVLREVLDSRAFQQSDFYVTVVGHVRLLPECFEDRDYHFLLAPYFNEADQQHLHPLLCSQPALALYDIWDNDKVKVMYETCFRREHAQLLESTEARVKWMMARDPSPSVPSAELQALPIYQYRDPVLAAVAQHRVTVISGHTGCGKSTQVPQYLLQADRTVKVVVTQPRRLAAVSLWQRVRAELGPELAHLVGFAIGGKRFNVASARILYCTTGWLLCTLRRDPELRSYTHVICDEVHERSLDGDLLLSWVRRLLESSHAPLKAVVMSATLSVDKFRGYFQERLGQDQVDVVEVAAPSRHAVDIHYLETIVIILELPPGLKETVLDLRKGKLLTEDRLEVGRQLIRFLHTTTRKDHAILVFLPGIASILDMHGLLEGVADLDLHVLHSEQPPEEQARVLEPSPAGRRKVILSTNIAESSLTLPDVDLVVDFCIGKEMLWYEKDRLQHLKEEWTSKDSATQRAGRTGRVRPGAVYRIVTQDEHEWFRQSRPPEMQRSPVASQLLRTLQIAAFGQQWCSVFLAALDPPGEDVLQSARQTLLDHNCVVAVPITAGSFEEQARCDTITGRGQVVASLPLDLRPAMLVLYGVACDCLLLAASAAAITRAAQFPIASATFFDVVSEATARWGYAGRWESDVIAGIAAHIHFRRFREAHRGVPQPPLRPFCQDRALNLSALLDVDQLFERILSRLSRAGVQGVNGGPGCSAAAAVTERMAAEFQNPDCRLLLSVLVAAAFCRNTLPVATDKPTASDCYSEIKYRQVTFLDVHPDVDTFCQYLIDKGIPQPESVESEDGAVVVVTFKSTEHSDDPPPVYLAAKLRGSAVERPNGSFEELKIAVAGTLGCAIRKREYTVRTEQRSVVHPVMLGFPPQDGLAVTACEMFKIGSRGDRLMARCLQLLPRCLPHLWRLVLWLFASDPRVVEPASGGGRVQIKATVEGGLKVQTEVDVLLEAIPDVNRKVDCLRRYLHGFLGQEEAGDVQEDVDGLLPDDFSEEDGEEELQPLWAARPGHAADPPRVVNGMPSPALAAACLLSLAKGLYRMHAVPNFAHFSRWLDPNQPHQPRQWETLYDSGWAMKPPTALGNCDVAWDDIWVAPPTPLQATAFSRLLQSRSRSSPIRAMTSSPIPEAQIPPQPPQPNPPESPSTSAGPLREASSRDRHYWKLLDMGFGVEQVIVALECYDGRLEHAVTMLTCADLWQPADGASSSSPPQPPEPAAPAPRPPSPAADPPQSTDTRGPEYSSSSSDHFFMPAAVATVQAAVGLLDENEEDGEALAEALAYLADSPALAPAEQPASDEHFTLPRHLQEALQMLAERGWRAVAQRYNLILDAGEASFVEQRQMVAQYRRWVATGRAGPFPAPWGLGPVAPTTPTAALPRLNGTALGQLAGPTMPAALPLELQWLADPGQVQRRLTAGWDPNTPLPPPPAVAAALPAADLVPPLWLASRLRLPATAAVLLACPATQRKAVGECHRHAEAPSVESPSPDLETPLRYWFYESLDDPDGGREVQLLEDLGETCRVLFLDSGDGAEGVVSKEQLYDSEAGGDPMVPDGEENAIGRLRRYLLEEAPDVVLAAAADLERHAAVLWPPHVRFALYGAAPGALESRGVTLLHRTFMECKPDHVARPLVLEILARLRLMAHADPEWLQRTGVALLPDGRPKAVIVELFAGSCNMSFWFHSLGGCPTFGFELHPEVHLCAERNLRLMGAPEAARGLLPLDFREGLRRLAAAGAVPADALVVCLIDPPWGEAMSLERGLDLRRTSPPVLDIIGSIVEYLPLEVAQGRAGCLIHTFTGTADAGPHPSVLEVAEACTRADLRRVRPWMRQGYLFGFF